MEERIAYLAHALLCIQAAPQTSRNMELRQDIQDKLDLARIQADIKQAIREDAGGRIPGHLAHQAMDELDREIFDVTELYDRFANAFDLSMQRLDILCCANHFDAEVVEDVYKKLLKRGL